MEWVLLLHAATTWAMVGLIWFVQVVHYPLFAWVGERRFIDYESRHTRRTSWVVGVFMPLEALTAAWLVLDVPDGVSRETALVGLGLVGLLWLSTAAWQAPLHGRLAAGFDSDLQRRLVQTNWVRTAGWTARGLVALALLAQAL